ncbi:MAG: MraY family glycosyltransferase [Nitrospirota bacterium]
MLTILLVVGSFVLSLSVTTSVRRYAIRHLLMDIPNTRSSHSEPTPRGGGLAIALTWFLALTILIVLQRIDDWVGMALLGGGGLVAGIGWIDDRRGVSAGMRATAHALAAVWAVWCLGGLRSLDVGVGVLHLGMAGSILAVVGITWLVNLYNFMDGIDGLAAGETVMVGLVGGGLLVCAGANGMALAAISLAAAAGGFAMFNWPPAKIFMGDVGSGLIGHAFGVLALASERAGAVPVMVWMILLAVFIVDATATLIRRVMNGERWYEAHRSHAYQRAVQAGYSHCQVTMAIMGLDALLAVAAVGVWAVPSVLPVAVILTGGLLFAVWYGFRRSAPAVVNSIN